MVQQLGSLWKVDVGHQPHSLSHLFQLVASLTGDPVYSKRVFTNQLGGTSSGISIPSGNVAIVRTGQ